MWRAVFGQIARRPWSEGIGVRTRGFKFKTLAGISIYAIAHCKYMGATKKERAL
jgi:hypothetical protein